MSTLKDQYAEVELQLGSKEHKCEVLFNYTPASQGSQFEPPEAEEFDIFRVTVLDCNGVEFDLNDDILDLLNDEIIAKIKEQKEG